MKTDCRLLVFSKAPHHGRVMTRLRPVLTPAGCVGLQRQLLLRTLLHGRAAFSDIELWTPPATGSRLLDRLSARLGLRLQPQHGNDLGQRMDHAIRQSFRQRAKAVLLIGSDCPFLDPGTLQQACAALRRHPCVFIPAGDGGFVLIGARRPLPARSFDGIAWGTGRVLDQVLAKMKKAGTDPLLLPALHDIDRPVDLRLLDRAELHRMRWLFGVQ